MATSSLQSYLKRYTSSDPEKPSSEGLNTKPKKKKKKQQLLQQKQSSKSKLVSSYSGVVIVDDDLAWHKQTQQETDEDVEEEEGPQVIEDTEVKMMQKMEAMRMHRPYLSIGEDGSGWVDISTSVKSAKQAERVVGDLSPPRRRHDSLSPSPEPEVKHDTSPEQDVESGFFRDRHPDSQTDDKRRKFRSTRDEDLSRPPQKSVTEAISSRIQHDEDLSPPRKRVRNEPLPIAGEERKFTAERDLSPPRRKNQASVRSDTDISPPRRRQRSDIAGSKTTDEYKTSKSIGRQVGREGLSESLDLSPPRKGSRDMNSASEISDLRRKTSNGENISSSNLNLQRKSLKVLESRHGTPNLDGRSSQSENGRVRGADETMKKRKMTDGSSAGLRSGSELKEEIERKKETEAKRIAEMDPLLSGKGAETVYRDKQGRKVKIHEDSLRVQEEEVKAKDEPLEWGKGLAQKREAEARIAELEMERYKPFARSRDDAELDKLLRERVHWGDPMAHLVKKKGNDQDLEDFGTHEQMKASGFIIPQAVPPHSWLKRGIHPPPNRYGIKPGRHWDGVDRSTGYEKELFKQKNEKKASELEAYLWSVSDM